MEKNGNLYLKYVESKNTRLKTAIMENRLSDIGKIKPKLKRIDINGDRKRFWPQKLSGINTNELNDSVPISLNHFAKDQI